MLLAFVTVFVVLVLLLFFWPHRLEGYYSGDGWFVEWRAYFFKSYFSSNGSTHSFMKWQLKDSTGGEEEQLSDELFEDPDFEPEIPKKKKATEPVKTRKKSEEKKKESKTVLVKEHAESDVESTITSESKDNVVSEAVDTEKSTVSSATLEEKIEKKVETFFEQPKSDDSDWDAWDDVKDDKEENWLSPKFVKAKIEEWKSLWEEYRKDIIKLLKWCKLFVVYCLKVAKPTICQVSLHGGLDNPADTGQFYAWFNNTFSYLPIYSWFSMHYTPHFGDDKEWSLDAKLLYKFNLLQLLAVTVLVVVTFPYFAYKRVKRKYNGEEGREAVVESA